MFDGEMVKRNFPFEKKFGLRKYSGSKTKLDLENFNHIYFLA